MIKEDENIVRIHESSLGMRIQSSTGAVLNLSTDDLCHFDNFPGNWEIIKRKLPALPAGYYIYRDGKFYKEVAE